MSSATRLDRTIIADKTGPNFPIYVPGPNSLDFMWTAINTTGLKHTKNQRHVPWSQKLALIANDALNDHSEEIGVDGFFFTSIASSSLFKRVGEDDLAFDDFPNILRYKMGPSLFFAPYTKSRQERDAWRSANVQERLQLQSLFWKSQALSDRHLVWPIWTDASLMPSGAREPSKNPAFTRSSPYPSLKALQSREEKDTTVDKTLGIIRGGSVVLLESKLWTCTAQHQKNKTGQSDKSHLMLRLRAQGTDSKLLRHIRSNFVDDDDQIVGFIKSIDKMYKENPEHMVTYAEAHCWGPAASTGNLSKLQRGRKQLTISLGCVPVSCRLRVVALSPPA